MNRFTNRFAEASTFVTYYFGQGLAEGGARPLRRGTVSDPLRRSDSARRTRVRATP